MFLSAKLQAFCSSCRKWQMRKHRERKGEREFEGRKEGWRGSGITSVVVLISASSWVKSLLFSSMSLTEHPPSHSRFSSSLGTSCTQERECSLCCDRSYIAAVSPDLLGSIFLPCTMLPPALVCSVPSRVHVAQNHVLKMRPQEMKVEDRDPRYVRSYSRSAVPPGRGAPE